MADTSKKVSELDWLTEQQKHEIISIAGADFYIAEDDDTYEELVNSAELEEWNARVFSPKNHGPNPRWYDETPSFSVAE